MELQDLISNFDYLSELDGVDLNALVDNCIFDIKEEAPQSPREFPLTEYAASVNGLSEGDLDILIANAGNNNPKRKIRRDQVK